VTFTVFRDPRNRREAQIGEQPETSSAPSAAAAGSADAQPGQSDDASIDSVGLASDHAGRSALEQLKTPIRNRRALIVGVTPRHRPSGRASQG